MQNGFTKNSGVASAKIEATRNRNLLTLTLVNLLLVLLPLALISCRESVTTKEEVDILGVGDALDSLQRIELQPDRLTLIPGDSSPLRSVAFAAYDETINITEAGSWTIADPTIARFSLGEIGNEGAEKQILLEALSTGTTKVVFQFRDRITEIPLTVLDRTLIGLTPSVENLELNLSLNNGKPVPKEFSLDVVGLFSDGVAENLNERVSWSLTSSDGAAAQVSQDKPGVFRATAPGTLRIRANFAGIGVSITAKIGVVDRKPASITTQPSVILVPNGRSATFQAFLHYTDQSVEKIEAFDRVKITSPQLFTIGEPETTSGETTFPLAAIGDGEGSLVVHYAGIEKAVSVKTIDAAIDRVEIESPQGTSIPVGKQVPLALMAYFSDGTKKNVTEQAIWESEAPSTAKFSSNESEIGMVVGRKVGTARISAAFAEVSDSKDIAVVAAIARELKLFSNDFGLLPKGLTRQYQVEATYTDDTTKPATSLVDWSIVSEGGAAGISAAGLVTALSPGTVRVVAELDDGTAETVLTIGNPQFSHLEIDAPSSTLSRGSAPYDLKLYTVDTEGTRVEVSSAAEWTYDMSSTGYTQVGYIDNDTQKGRLYIGLGANGRFKVVCHYQGSKAELVITVVD